MAYYFLNGKSCIDQLPTHGPVTGQLAWDLKGKPMKLELWDTPGQELLTVIMAPYVQSADAFLMVFDVTSLRSIQELKGYFQRLFHHARASHPPLVFILANKADRIQEGEVIDICDTGEQANATMGVSERTQLIQNTMDEMEDSIHTLLREKGHDEGHVSCYVVSAKTGMNCLEVLEQLQLRLAYRQMQIIDEEGKPNQTAQSKCSIG